jgi:transcriptional regulator with XRE-family HTH domain
MSDFAKWLKSHRVEKRFTQRGLGKVVGTSGSNISRIEAGKYVPDALTVAALARALQQSSSEAQRIAGYDSFTDDERRMIEELIEQAMALDPARRHIIIDELRKRLALTREGQPNHISSEPA